MSSPAHTVTQSDVARAAGVSRSLVSLALSGSPKVAQDTRAHVLRVAGELGYRVNMAASSLARQRSTIIGLVLPNLRNAFFERVARCLGQAASDQGLTLFVTVGAEQAQVLHQAIDSLLGVRVAGIILVSPWLADEDLLAIAEEAPTCVVGRASPGDPVDCVHIDEPTAARLIVDHLVGQGARTIAYICPERTDAASRRERQRALTTAAQGAGRPLAVYECGEDAGPAVRTALSDHPGALGLVMHNDVLAIDAVPVLREAQRPPGARVVLASYDNTYLAQREEFSLTSIHQPEERLAEQAVSLICRRAGIGRESARSEPEPAGARPPSRSVVVEPALVVRASSLERSDEAQPE